MGGNPTAEPRDVFIPGSNSGGPSHRDRRVVMPPRPKGGPPVQALGYFKNSRVVYPAPFVRCTIIPDEAYWASRDIMADIQWMARAGFIPVTPVDPTVESLRDFAWRPAGWKAYGFAIPPGGRLQVEVQHEKLGWFRLMAVDRWGKPGAGMLQAAIAYRPVMVTLSNPGTEANCAYVIVDDPGWWSDKESQYTLIVRRDWDPAKVDLSKAKMVAGIWGSSPSVSAEFRGPSHTGPAVFPH